MTTACHFLSSNRFFFPPPPFFGAVATGHETSSSMSPQNSGGLSLQHTGTAHTQHAPGAPRRRLGDIHPLHHPAARRREGAEKALSESRPQLHGGGGNKWKRIAARARRGLGSVAVLQELPLHVAQRAHLPGLEPPRDAVHVERVVAHPRRRRALRPQLVSDLVLRRLVEGSVGQSRRPRRTQGRPEPVGRGRPDSPGTRCTAP